MLMLRSGATAASYLLADYDPATFQKGGGSLQITGLRAAGAKGRLQTSFNLQLNGTAEELTQAPLMVIYASGPVSETGQLQPHKGRVGNPEPVLSILADYPFVHIAAVTKRKADHSIWTIHMVPHVHQFKNTGACLCVHACTGCDEIVNGYKQWEGKQWNGHCPAYQSCVIREKASAVADFGQHSSAATVATHQANLAEAHQQLACMTRPTTQTMSTYSKHFSFAMPADAGAYVFVPVVHRALLQNWT